MAHSSDSDEMSLEPGEEVYDRRGRAVARITGMTDNGYEIEAIEESEADGEEMPGPDFGEGYLMWRCTECGEMGELDDGMPETCPECGAKKEALTGVVED